MALLSGETLRVPLPPPRLWGGVAALTLALEALGDAAAGARVRASGGYAVLEADESPAVFKDRLLAAYPPGMAGLHGWGARAAGGGAGNTWPDVPLESLPGVTAHDKSKYLAGVLRRLCVESSPSAATLRGLAEAVARVYAGSCRASALEPAEPVGVLRAEFYEFVRGFGGSLPTTSRWKTVDVLRVPALAQALALLGHAYTLTHWDRRERYSLHLAAAGPGAPPAAAVRARAAVACTLQSLDGRAPAPLLALAAAAGLAEAGLDAAAAVGADMLAARLSYGKTVGVAWVQPVPAATLYRLLSRAAAAAFGAGWRESLAKALLQALSAGSCWEAGGGGGGLPGGLLGLHCTCASVSREEVRLAGEAASRFRQLADRYASGLAEYAYHLTLYADSLASGAPAAEYAYAAARTALGLADEVARAAAGGYAGRLSRTVAPLRRLASLASAAALLESLEA